MVFGQVKHPSYTKNPKTRTIDIDPEVSKITKNAFQIFAEGKKILFGIKRQSRKPLHVNQIRKLINKFYIGILKYAGEYY